MNEVVEIKKPRKLIEVAMPLDAINAESVRRKRKAPAGYPTTLHKWWAQRPLAAVRGVLFAQLVNDPSWRWELENPGALPPNHLKATWAKTRRRLFGLIDEIILWDNTQSRAVFAKAQIEIERSWRECCEVNADHPDASTLFNPDLLPSLHDPFAGGGSIPMEAQRLGLHPIATDLNPVAVVLNKAMIEIPARFDGREPISASSGTAELALGSTWMGASGLAEDVRHYGSQLASVAWGEIGHLYPSVTVTEDMCRGRPDLEPYVGEALEPVAWLWARTVRSPSPAFRHAETPIAASFVLSTNSANPIYVEPEVRGDQYEFIVRTGKPTASAKAGTKIARGSFGCILSGAPITYSYIDDEANAGRMGRRLMAIVCEGKRGRVYLPPTPDAVAAAESAEPTWRPDTPARGTFASNAQGRKYGFSTFADYFTPRQLCALNALIDNLASLQLTVKADAVRAGFADDDASLEGGGTGARAYAEAVITYLAFAIDRVADYGSAISTWRNKDSAMRSALASQSIQMAWDFAEGSPFGRSSSGFEESVKVVAKAIPYLATNKVGVATQAAAQSQSFSRNNFVSTDPPYYNNIGYADLSDFLYIWMRRSLRSVFPSVLGTMVVPKTEELVATPYRHGSDEEAEAFFLDGMTQAMSMLAQQAHPAAPITIYYAYKQSETESEGGTSSTGWETFLEAVCRAGLTVTGTWPVRTEGDNRQVGQDSNALASSIVLVCRPRHADAPTISRRSFIRDLNQVLPQALDEMTRGTGDERTPVRAADLSQAIIGPGMAVYSRYAAVLEADGTPMSVKAALKLINRFMAEDDFDADTQFCLHWFEQTGWAEGAFGDADQLARAKGTAVNGVKAAGVIEAASGKVRLLRWSEYASEWDPSKDDRLPVWEVLHQLIRLFKSHGEAAAGAALGAVTNKGDAARQLAYRLYTMCERAGLSDDARAYNEIISSWAAVEESSARSGAQRQTSLFDV